MKQCACLIVNEYICNEQEFKYVVFLDFTSVPSFLCALGWISKDFDIETLNTVNRIHVEKTGRR